MSTNIEPAGGLTVQRLYEDTNGWTIIGFAEDISDLNVCPYNSTKGTYIANTRTAWINGATYPRVHDLVVQAFLTGRKISQITLDVFDQAYITALALSVTSPKCIAFVGDSITQLWPLHTLVTGQQTTFNKGIGGQISSQMQARFQEDVMILQPAIVHILAGTNDVTTGQSLTTSYIQQMAQAALAAGAKVILGKVIPSQTSSENSGLQSFNAMLVTLAASLNVPLVDYWSVMANQDGTANSSLYQDVHHPNNAGYTAMFGQLNATLQAAGWVP